jgi:hypothetical protein
MQYHKEIEQAEYDNNGNYTIQSRYILLGRKKKMNVFCFEYNSKNERKVEIYYNYNLNHELKKLMTYIENKNNIEYDINFGKEVNEELYDLLKKMFHLKNEVKCRYNNDSGNCILS